MTSARRNDETAPAPGAERVAEEIPTITSTLGTALVAVELRRVLRITPEPGDDTFPEARSVDLAAHWGVPVRSGIARRALLIPAGDAVLRLFLGEDLRVVSFPSTAVLAVPAFLRGWAKRAVVRKLIASGDSLGYLIAVERLSSLMEQEPK